MLYKYWTNFNHKRARTNEYEVLLAPAEGYWRFETTIDPKYLDDMSPTNRNRFLFQMEEHYR